MPVVIALLRGVNVGGHNKMKMESLRALCESLDLHDAQTYIQSGNVVFRTRERNLAALAKRMQSAMEKDFGFRPEVVLRTSSELREAVAKNPFARRSDVPPNKLHVNFLAGAPAADAPTKLAAMKADPEELIIDGRELYIHFPNGVGQSKLSWSAVDKALQTPVTGRNWNTVLKLLAMAGELEKI
jgi:uncharacterized protein (DUF1697 family)